MRRDRFLKVVEPEGAFFCPVNLSEGTVVVHEAAARFSISL